MLNGSSSCSTLNHLILIGKYFLYYKALNNVKFQFADFINLVYDKIETEQRYIALMSNKYNTFFEKWSFLIAELRLVNQSSHENLVVTSAHTYAQIRPGDKFASVRTLIWSHSYRKSNAKTFTVGPGLDRGRFSCAVPATDQGWKIN